MHDIPTETLLSDLRELEDIQRENYVGSPRWSQAERFLRAIGNLR